jgi:hypothetical protein
MKPGYLKAHIMYILHTYPEEEGCHISSLCCMYVPTYIPGTRCCIQISIHWITSISLASRRTVFAPPSLARRLQLSPPFFFPAPRGFQHSLLCRLHCSPSPRNRCLFPCTSSSRKGAPPPPPPTLLSEFP